MIEQTQSRLEITGRLIERLLLLLLLLLLINTSNRARFVLSLSLMDFRKRENRDNSRTHTRITLIGEDVTIIAIRAVRHIRVRYSFVRKPNNGAGQRRDISRRVGWDGDTRFIFIRNYISQSLARSFFTISLLCTSSPPPHRIVVVHVRTENEIAFFVIVDNSLPGGCRSPYEAISCVRISLRAIAPLMT